MWEFGGLPLPALVPPLVAAGALSVYFALPLLRIPQRRRIPWAFLVVGVGAAVIAPYRVARAPGVATAVAAATTIAILGFATWFFFVFSMYRRREERPAVGERFPDFALPASDGSTFRPADARGRRPLVLCYRGDW